MSTSWGDAVAAEEDTTVIITDHGDQVGRMEAVAFQHSHLRYGVSYRQGYRKGFREAVAWVLYLQGEYASLPDWKKQQEADKGRQSIYYPILKETNR